MRSAIGRRCVSLLVVCVIVLEATAVAAAEPTTASVSSAPIPKGMFVSDDQRFPFALLFEAQTPEVYLVRGLGRIAYSADDPTELTVEMQGLGRATSQFTIRGTLHVRPDGKRMTEPQTFPWVGRYDAASDELQLQVSSKHLVRAVRPNAAAAKNGQHAQAAGRDPSDSGLDMMQMIMLATAAHAAYGPTLGRGESTPVPTSGNPPPASSGDRSEASSPRPIANGSSTIDPLAADYIENLLIVMHATGRPPYRLFDAGTSTTGQATGRATAVGPSSTSTNSTGSTSTPAAPTGPPLDPPMPRSVDPPQPTDVVGRSLDEALTTLWGRGLNPASFVNLGPPPDPSQAEQVTGITVLPDGRIQVRFYGSPPRVAGNAATPRVRGGTTSALGSTTTAGRANRGAPTNPPNVGGPRRPTTPPGVPPRSSTSSIGPPPAAWNEPSTAVQAASRLGSQTRSDPPTPLPSGRRGEENTAVVSSDDRSRPNGVDRPTSVTLDARAAANAAAAGRALYKGPRHDDDQPDRAAAPAGPTGFQPGDIATLLPGADLAQEKILYDGQAISVKLKRASGLTGLSICSLGIPEVAAGLQGQLQTWPKTKYQGGPGLTVTVRAQSATPNEGILDYDYDFSINSVSDASSYAHYVVYRGFYISYVSNVWDRVTPDLGRPWPTFLDNARQLVDRRFPPQEPGHSGEPK